MNAKYHFVPGRDDIVDLFLSARGIFGLDREIIVNKSDVATPPEALVDPDVVMSKLGQAENVIIHGDYDADGVCATAIVHRATGFDWYIPERSEGYGLRLSFVEQLSPGTLVFSVDCGITSANVVNAGRQRGIDFLITDHHEPVEGMIPDGVVINPKLVPGVYDNLSGSEVARRVVESVYGSTRAGAQLSAIGTVCDIVPLLNENRAVVIEGLRSMRSNPIVPIKALCDEMRIPIEKLNERDLGWGIGPVINAAGRMGNAALAIEMMATTDYGYARILAGEMVALNKQRKKEMMDLVDSAMDVVDDLGGVSFVVLNNPRVGLIGLVANRILRTTDQPAVVVALDDDGTCKASARAPVWFGCVNMVNHMRDVLNGGGGHNGAAGFEFHIDQIDDVKKLIAEYASGIERPERDGPIADIYGDVDDIVAHVPKIWELAPFGFQFEQPLFRSEVEITRVRETRSGYTMFSADGHDCIWYRSRDRTPLAGVNRARARMTYTVAVAKMRSATGVMLEVNGLLLL